MVRILDYLPPGDSGEDENEDDEATGRQTMLFSSGRVRERACLHHVAERLRSLGAWARQELRGRGGAEAEEGDPAGPAGSGVMSLKGGHAQVRYGSADDAVFVWEGPREGPWPRPWPRPHRRT